MALILEGSYEHVVTDFDNSTKLGFFSLRKFEFLLHVRKVFKATIRYNYHDVRFFVCNKSQKCVQLYYDLI